jgi:adenylyltransferase/sulfurtransferase
VVAAAERLAALAPATRTLARCTRFTGRETEWLAAADVVLDGTDGIDAKFLVSDAAVAAGVPLVHAGAVAFRAQVLTVLPGATACYRCIFEDAPPPGDVPACQDAGVLGPTVTLAGSLQAAEALRLLTGAPPHFADRLVSIDLRTGAWRSVPVARRPHCAACGVLADEDAPQRSDAS